MEMKVFDGAWGKLTGTGTVMPSDSRPTFTLYRLSFNIYAFLLPSSRERLVTEAVYEVIIG